MPISETLVVTASHTTAGGKNLSKTGTLTINDTSYFPQITQTTFVDPDDKDIVLTSIPDGTYFGIIVKIENLAQIWYEKYQQGELVLGFSTISGTTTTTPHPTYGGNGIENEILDEVRDEYGNAIEMTVFEIWKADNLGAIKVQLKKGSTVGSEGGSINVIKPNYVVDITQTSFGTSETSNGYYIKRNVSVYERIRNKYGNNINLVNANVTVNVANNVAIIGDYRNFPQETGQHRPASTTTPGLDNGGYFTEYGSSKLNIGNVARTYSGFGGTFFVDGYGSPADIVYAYIRYFTSGDTRESLSILNTTTSVGRKYGKFIVRFQALHCSSFKMILSVKNSSGTTIASYDTSTILGFLYSSIPASDEWLRRNGSFYIDVPSGGSVTMNIDYVPGAWDSNFKQPWWLLVTISAHNANNNPALFIGDAFEQSDVVINNNGRIYGRGGNGYNGTYNQAELGKMKPYRYVENYRNALMNGGDAIVSADVKSLVINNYGQIYSGGGASRFTGTAINGTMFITNDPKWFAAGYPACGGAPFGRGGSLVKNDGNVHVYANGSFETSGSGMPIGRNPTWTIEGTTHPISFTGYYYRGFTGAVINNLSGGTVRGASVNQTEWYSLNA